jgi:hypothetical protein
VRCEGDTIALVDASPANGYRADTQNDGPRRVRVTFVRRNGSFTQIRATCSGGVAQPSIEDVVIDSGRGDGGGEGDG